MRLSNSQPDLTKHPDRDAIADILCNIFFQALRRSLLRYFERQFCDTISSRSYQT